jgi:hypothetical protein
MIWDKKYQFWIPEIICPVCKMRIDLKEWEDYGMHLHCTEYYISGRYFLDKEKVQELKQENIGV